MTKVVGRIVDGVASVEPDIIEWKECRHCAEEIRRRSYTCKSCGCTHSDEKYKAEQAIFAKLEAKMRREKASAESS